MPSLSCEDYHDVSVGTPAHDGPPMRDVSVSPGESSPVSSLPAIIAKTFHQHDYGKGFWIKAHCSWFRVNFVARRALFTPVNVELGADVRTLSQERRTLALYVHGGHHDARDFGLVLVILLTLIAYCCLKELGSE